LADDPVDIAARALQHRDRSRADVLARLERAGVGAEERAAALETLERLGWVDDARFAVTRAAALAGRGNGDAAIRADLEASGVDPEQVEEAVGSLEPELERARAIVGETGATPARARALARKGFGDETVEALVAAGYAGEEGIGV
jgi:regulatory protein